MDLDLPKLPMVGIFLKSVAKAFKKGKDNRASMMAMNGMVIKQRHLSIERDNMVSLAFEVIGRRK